MKIALTLFLALVMIFTMSGCSKDKAGKSDTSAKIEKVIEDNKELITKVIELAAEKGTKEGLKKWAEKNPEAAKETAQLISLDFETNVIPFLNGHIDFSTQAEVDTFLSSSIADKFPDEAKDAISAAFAVLDIYVKVPESDTLKKDYLDFIKAFVKGVKSGCDKYLK